MIVGMGHAAVSSLARSQREGLVHVRPDPRCPPGAVTIAFLQEQGDPVTALTNQRRQANVNQTTKSRNRPAARDAVYDFIRAEVGAGRPIPGAKQIAEHMSHDECHARDALSRLVREGKLDRTKEPSSHRLGYRWVYAIASG